MTIENLTTERKERKERSYYTQEGFPVSSENVYFRGNDQPYFLIDDQNGGKEMTRISLIELRDEGDLSQSE